ncbi:MAG: tetratricopeptide repeat protein, partial [bacterium]
MSKRSVPLLPILLGFATFGVVLALTWPASVRDLSLDDIVHLRDYPRENQGRGVWQTLELKHWQSVPGDGLWRPVPKLLWRAIGPVEDGRTRVAWIVTGALAGLCVCLFAFWLEPIVRPRWLLVFCVTPFLHLLSADVILPFVGQADLLAAAGVLGAWACWARRGWAAGCAGAGFLALAMFSKESAYPAVLAIPVAIWFGASSSRLRLRMARRALVLGLIVLGARLGAQALIFGTLQAPVGAGGQRAIAGERAVSALELTDRYAVALIVPLHAPQTDYSFLKQKSHESSSHGFWTFLTLAAFVGVAIGFPLRAARPNRKNMEKWKGWRSAMGAMVWAILFLLPYLGLIPLGAVWSGRFAFLSLFGWVAFLICYGFKTDVVYLALICLWGALCLPQGAADWKDPIRLWTAEVERQPDHAFAWKNLGAHLDQKGKTEQALECFRKATEYWPEFAEAWLARGQAASR